MTLRSLISILTLSFASFSAMSFQLPASMISMNSAFAESPAKSALFHQETGPLRSRILDQYQKWKGTQYQWGGTSHRGVDCSALMQHLFSDAAHLNLPRTTSEQIHRGVQVAQYRLKAGDRSSSRRRQTESMSVSTSVTTGLFTPPAAGGDGVNPDR